MIEICRNEKELEIKRKYQSFVNYKEKQLLFSPNIFEEARFFFNNEECLLISVVNNEGDILFYLTQNKDYYLENGQCFEIETNYEGCNLVKEKEFLDTYIIDMYDSFLFYEMEEYTHAIADFIVKCYPEKKVYFKDTIAKRFWENNEVCLFDSIESVNNVGRVLNITSERKRCSTSVPLILSNVQSSIFVMANLTWARKRRSFGLLNEDKVIVIIDYPVSGGGMGDIVRNVQGYIQLIRRKGWIPIVRLGRDNQYLENENDNMWDYYFDNVSEVSLEEAMKSKNVVCGDDNHFTWMPERILLGIDTKKNRNISIHFNKETLQYFHKSMPFEFNQNKKILGVIARGTDLNKLSGSVVDIDVLLETCRKEFEKEYDYIFLATEDKHYYEIFFEEYGDKLLCIPQKRIDYDFVNEKYILISKLFQYNAKERKEWGRQYLLISYCLSLCESLITTLPCGCWRLAHQWRDKEYQFEKIVFAPNQTYCGEYKYKDAQNKLKIASFIKNSVFTVIYGTGHDADTLIPILDIYKDKIVFCDKKAINECYYFKGIEVVEPIQLLNQYKGSQILISSTFYEQEIEKELINLGIAKSRIFKLSQLIK